MRIFCGLFTRAPTSPLPSLEARLSLHFGGVAALGARTTVKRYLSQAARALLNDQIKGPTVRLITESGNEIISSRVALSRARECGLDLVAVAPEANPMVVKIMDYHRVTYERKVKDKEAKKEKKASIGQMKEIKLKALIENHDLGIKVNKISEALTKLHPVKVIIRANFRMLRLKPDSLAEIPDRVLGALSERNCSFSLNSQVNQPQSVELVLMPKAPSK